MSFNWIISLGDVIATLSMFVAFFGIVYKILSNHLSHMETRLTTQIDRVATAQTFLTSAFIAHLEKEHQS